MCMKHSFNTIVIFLASEEFLDLHRASVKGEFWNKTINLCTIIANNLFICAGNLEEIAKLVKDGAVVDEKDADGYTPLVYAAKAG